MKRRDFLNRLALTTGAVVLVPAVHACGGAQTQPTSMPTSTWTPPLAPPAGWDAIAWNRDRGNAGYIPDSYLPDINGPVGETDHLGKHLPFVPEVDAQLVPGGFLAIMWGDPARGHARHPNAVRSEANQFEGHWYNWIRVRKATNSDAEELESTYTEWPGSGPDDSGAYAVLGGGDITADSGKNTIYLAALPADVRSGDTVRIWAHCLTHGEYVDFLVVP
jgi:hypothetical protein